MGWGFDSVVSLTKSWDLPIECVRVSSFLVFPVGCLGLGFPLGSPLLPFGFPGVWGPLLGSPFWVSLFWGSPFGFSLSFWGSWVFGAFLGSPFVVPLFRLLLLLTWSQLPAMLGFTVFSSITYHQFHSTIFEIHVNVILYWGFEGFILVLGHSIAFSISALAFSLSSCGFACGFGHL